MIRTSKTLLPTVRLKRSDTTDKCADEYVLNQGNASCPNLFILTSLINSDEQIL
jgi:hypothetical protein